MITVAKEEMRAAGHAPATNATLFDGCTVAVVKVAPVQTSPATCAKLCSFRGCVEVRNLSNYSKVPEVDGMLDQ